MGKKDNGLLYVRKSLPIKQICSFTNCYNFYGGYIILSMQYNICIRRD